MDENLTTQHAEAPFNIQGFIEYCGGNKALVQKLLDSFVQVGPQYFKELSDAVESCQSEDIRALCHKIRGAGSIICAEHLLMIVDKIRQNAVDADYERAKASLPELKKAFSDVTDFINGLGAISS
jgi:HPt (histidine-containing phosphotransfer) domain-containing protein